MKKIFVSLMLVLSVCLGAVVGCYAEPAGQTAQPAQTQTQTIDEDKTPEASQSETAEPVEKKVEKQQEKTPKTQPKTKPAQVPAAPAAESGAMGIRDIMAIVYAALSLVLLILLLVMFNLKSKGNVSKIKESIKNIREINSKEFQDIRETNALLQQEIGLLRRQLSTLSENMAGMNTSTPVAPPPVVQQPVVELTFEEKINNALNFDHMSELGMAAVEVSDDGGLIDIRPSSGSNVMFYCKKDSDGITMNIYPDSKIKERVWESRYAQWFDITRNADTGTSINLSRPLVIKLNQVSGRYDLISKGNVTIF